MKNNVNSLAIGMFVLGAALISVATVIIFGAAKFFEDDEIFASKFSETVNGLDVGAPVKFKGVKIGKVERIAIASPRPADNAKSDREDMVLVIYSIDLNLLKRRMRETHNVSGEDWIRAQIREGLRAKLNYQSIVTGMLYVELDYFAEPDPNMKLRETPKFMSIPSESSGLSELMKSMQDSIASISRIDFAALFKNANDLIVNLNKKVEAIDAQNLNASAAQTLRSADAFLRNADSLATGAKSTLKNLDSTLKSTDKNISALSADASKTLASIDALAANLGAITAPNSQLRFELASLISAMKNSMNSMGNLAEYIQRNPSALITGKSAATADKKD